MTKEKSRNPYLKMTKEKSRKTKTVGDVGEFKEEIDDPDNEEMEEQLPKWYDQMKDEKFEYIPPTEEELVSLRIEAQTILEAETKFYLNKKAGGKKGTNAAWLKIFLTKGTAKDKVAAHVVTIQNSPIHNLQTLTSLVNMVKPSKKKECLLVMETLSELFLEDLLRPDRKLRSFDKQPLTKLNDITSGCAKARRLKLSAWLFEDKLKDLYKQFIDAVNNVAKDTVEANRIKAVSIMNNLLSGHPEQEQVLLNNLINKLGDPNQKVAAKVIYCLTQLLRVHPNMKQIIMDEVEKLLFRPNMSVRTQYYCICFLSQFIFSNKDIAVARNMINIYFSFFKASIKKAEIDSRLMGALLMGVKRAHPFAKLDGGLTEHVDTLYKLVHMTTFNIALHALCLLEQVSSSADDRFYSALYKKLLDPKLGTSCHHAMLINLLYKTISKDTNLCRVQAFIKRIFQICLHLPVPLTCGLLYLVSKLISRNRKALYSFSLVPQENALASLDKFESDDEEEKYVDVDDEEDAVKTEQGENTVSNVEEKEKRKPLLSWVHCELSNQKKKVKSIYYDPFARNPAYSQADKTIYLELNELVHHFHPTVALFANKILSQTLIIYGGDPLQDFSLNRFLERFVFKNPKNLGGDDDGVEKGPDPQLASRKYYAPQGVKSMSVTSDNYLNQREHEIPVDELFLYRYLKEKQVNRPPQSGKDDDDSDNDSVASEEFEEMLDKMIGGKKEKKFDYLDEIGDSMKKKSNKKSNDDDEEEDVSEGEEEDEDVEDEEFSDVDEQMTDDENEVLDFGSDNEFDEKLDIDEILASEKGGKKKKNKNEKSKPKKMKNSNDLEKLFAPAEEFAEILEEAGSSAQKQGMIGSLQNKDNAAPKQIEWEKKRNAWTRNNPHQTKRKANFKHKFVKKHKKM